MSVFAPLWRVSLRSSLLLLPVLAGCGLFSPSITKLAALPDIKPQVSLKTVWQASVGKSGGYLFSPAVDGDAVLVAGMDGQITSLEAGTGRTRWKADVGQTLSGGVGAGAGMVLAATAKGELVAFDRSGKPLWRAQLAGEVLAPPVVEGNIVIGRTADGRVFGLSAADGTRKWVYQRTLPALTLRSGAGIQLGRGGAFLGMAGGLVAALDPDSGRVWWEVTIAQPRGSTELERIADVASLPAVSDQQVCAVAYQGRVACLDGKSGTLNWAKDLSSSAGLALDERHVYVPDDGGVVLALDLRTGASVWKQDALAGRRLSAPLVLGRHVLVGDAQGYVHVLSSDNGALIGRLATDGSAISVPLQATGNHVLVQTRAGGVYALSLN